MPRRELNDDAWARLLVMLPAERGRRGRPWNDHRRTVGGIFWILRTGAPWRDLPRAFGAWQTVYGRFNRWSRDGTWQRLHRAALQLAERAGALDLDLWFIDGTSIRGSRAAAGARKVRDGSEPEDHALGRSRGGFGTKLHLICDRQGLALAAVVSPGQRHESRCFETAMAAVSIPRRRGPARRRPRRLCGDKAYSVGWIRRWLRQRRITPVIPVRSDQRPQQRFDRAAYRERNIVERCVAWLKEARRVGTRYEKLARNFLGMIHVAMIGQVLRRLSTGPRVVLRAA
jgi:transposase